MFVSFGLAFANDTLLRYREQTGYSTQDLHDHVKYSSCFLDTFLQDLEGFAAFNANTKLFVSVFPTSHMLDLRKITRRCLSIPRIFS